MSESESSTANEPPQRGRLAACADVGLIFLVFLVFAGWPAPDVNEAHYLSKAKHYWNPDWCPGDAFLESADAHEVFYWTFGWLTLFFPLPAVAWIGRLLTWWLTAWAWRRLSFAIVPHPWVAVLSAGLCLLFLQRCHMAGEWIIGGVEAKGFAFPLVLLGLEAVVRGRWRIVWPLLGAASAFHVLVGGWAVVAVLFAWLWAGRKQASLLAIAPFLIGGLLLALPGLIPAAALTWNEDPQIVRQANDIYVFRRLDHHLVFLSLVEERSQWHKIIRHVTLAVFWLVAAVSLRRWEPVRRLNLVVAGAVLIALCGVGVDYATHQNNQLGAKLLRFYWFRLSDALLPMGTALSLVAGIEILRQRRPLASSAITVAAMAAAGINLGLIFISQRNDFRPRADHQSLAADAGDSEATRRHFENWKSVCGWIHENTQQDAKFLTPYHQQTFKWYAGRSEVVTKKDIPQDARGIVRWWNTLNEIYPPKVQRHGLCARGDGKLAELARRHGATYIIIDRGWRALSLTRVYPPPGIENTSFEIYRVPPPPPPLSDDDFSIQNKLDGATTD